MERMRAALEAIMPFTESSSATQVRGSTPSFAAQSRYTCGSGLLQGYPAVEAALGFMLPALFMSFLLASFQRKQSLCVTAALVGALAGVTLFSIPVAILAGIVCGCLTALIQAFWQGAPDEL